ncbi:hypothetical protein PLESTB_001096400 [Pleodorina starrii]|uniref:Protein DETOXIFICATION n=1 Tax=Pleodorina starrii TaxID=330485 RepID=A0A9W6BRU7_9CHLO|nr:hypothetical protein PLESTB_001096400 [Pleodorina starrii]
MPNLRHNVALGPTPPTSSTRALWVAELRSLGALALPVVIQTSAQQGMSVIDQVFLGHLGTAELGASALANAFTNLMWFFLLGFATALDTLGSHAYGAGDRRALVTCCITATVLLTLLVVPLAGGMALGEPVGRVLFGQDAHTAALMGRFCNGLILGMWPLTWGTVLTKYLQVQNIMLLPSLIAVAAFLLNIAFNAALVRTIGFSGAPLATSLSRWAQFLMLVAAVWRQEGQWRRQHKCRPSSEEGEAFAGEEGLALRPLPTGPASITEAETEAADGSRRGGAAVDLEPPSYGVTGEEPLLLTEDRTGGRSDDGDLALGGCVYAGKQGDARGSANGVALRAGVAGADDRGSSGSGSIGISGGTGAGMAPSPSERAVLPLPPAPAPRSLWRALCGEIRAAMQPRIVVRFLRLGIPGGLSMAFEASCFDFSTILAGRLGAVATAAHAATLSVVMLTYLACPFALATAGAIRVGNLLGAGEPDGARRAGILAVALSGFFMFLMAVTILATRSVLGYVFSTDPRVIAVIRDLAVFAALFQVSDGLMGSSQGVLRGCGHQHLTAVFNFAGFWVCGVLLGYLLCFKAGMGVKGLWAGISTGDTATGIMNLTAMSRIRWRKESDKAVARLKALAEQAEEEQAMLGGTGAEGLDAGGSDGGLAAGSSGVASMGGGGRSYAGGLKRMWSERRLSQAVKDAHARRELGATGRQGSVTLRLIRSLSSMFRRPRVVTQESAGGVAGGVEGGGGGGLEAGVEVQLGAREQRQVELIP